MRPLAFHPNVALPPPSPPPTHAASSASGSESSFAAVLNGIDTHEVHAKPKGQKSDGAAEPQESIANSGNSSEEKPGSHSPPSIEAALAALGYRTSAVSADPGSKDPAPQGAGAGSAPSVAAVATPRTRAPAPQQAAIAAAENVSANTADGAPIQNLLSSDPALGLQSVQTRTHLALVDTLPASAKLYRTEAASGPPLRTTPAVDAPQASGADGRVTQPESLALPALRAQNVIASLAGAAEASVAASPLAAPDLKNNAPVASRTQSGARLAPSSPVPTIGRGHATTPPGSPGKSNAVSPTPGESPRNSEGDSDAIGEEVSTAASDATFATSNATLATGTAAQSAIPINQLADFVATQAASLSAEIPSASTRQTSATVTPQAIKELEIALDPADLGAISIKMRLANGKLTVVIGAANASTRQAIESDRQVIVDRLASSQQTLEALIVKSEGPTQNLSGGNDASDPNEPRQSPANGDPASAERGAGGGSKFGRGRASDETLESAASRGRSGDLIV